MCAANLSELSRRLQHLEEELRNREREIALLKQIGDAVSAELNLEKLFQLVARHARDVIDADTLLIPVLDEACTEYTYRAGCGTNADEIVGESLPIDFGVCGWVWRHKRPWWKGVLEELDASEKNRWEKEAGTVILVPLVGKRHFLGGIAGIDKRGGGEFDKRDLDLLSLFANQVAVAIDNAIAYGELNAARRQAEGYQRELEKTNRRLEITNTELERLALYDQLTGLPNRSLLWDRLEHALAVADREGDTLAVLMIDLDHFKEVNDTLGHDMGDRLLRHVSARFQEALRATDTVARLGGDEFAVVLPGVDVRHASLIADGLLKALELPFDMGDASFSTTASIGIAAFPEHGDEAAMLLRRADVAMYQAKRERAGRAVYDAVEDHHSPGRLAMMGDLREAIQSGGLELHYQPKVDLKTGQVVGIEALARWPSQRHGPVSPEIFIGVMEQTGLIKPFTAWALDHGLKQCHDWRLKGMDLSLAVNLSVHNLLDPDFPDLVETLLDRWGDCRGGLVLEITESAVMADTRHSADVLTRLSKRGVRFSIDDFGTGYSSLVRLKRLPVTELKIDRSFVAGMLENKDDAVIVRSTLDLGHNLGLKVVAEGVEDEATLEYLRAVGCDLAQGYHIARPLPAEELEAFVKESLSAVSAAL